MAASRAWSEFLSNLREITALLRADPSSAYARRAADAAMQPPPALSVPLSGAINKGCVMLLSGRLQGCIASLLEEFLEALDQSGVVVDSVPAEIRAQLCRLYVEKPGPGRLAVGPTREVHQRYAVLWVSGSTLRPGTIKTDSFRDDGNPWPHKVRSLLSRCDVDLRSAVVAKHGQGYWDDLETYVAELIVFRNAVAHGDNPGAPWSARDVRRHMLWATRMVRACDEQLQAKLLLITGSGWPA